MLSALLLNAVPCAAAALVPVQPEQAGPDCSELRAVLPNLHSVACAPSPGAATPGRSHETARPQVESNTRDSAPGKSPLRMPASAPLRGQPAVTKLEALHTREGYGFANPCLACCACLQAERGRVWECGFCALGAEHGHSFRWVIGGNSYQDKGPRCQRCLNALGEDRASPFYLKYPSCEVEGCRVPRRPPGDPRGGVRDQPQAELVQMNNALVARGGGKDLSAFFPHDLHLTSRFRQQGGWRPLGFNRSIVSA
jgi:hypothetical protein